MSIQVLEYVPSIALILLGCYIMITADKSSRQAMRRMEENDDRYYREQDELRAYPWRNNPKFIRTSGTFVMMCGIVIFTIRIIA